MPTVVAEADVTVLRLQTLEAEVTTELIEAQGPIIGRITVPSVVQANVSCVSVVQGRITLETVNIGGLSV